MGPLSLERQVLFWAAMLAALLFALYLLGSTVTPFVAGIALGYLLDPVVNRLETLGLNRLGASLVILVVFVTVFGVILIFVAPILGDQLVSFAQRLPMYATRLQTLAIDESNALIGKYGGELAQRIRARQNRIESSNSKLGRRFCRARRAMVAQRPEIARFGAAPPYSGSCRCSS